MNVLPTGFYIFYSFFVTVTVTYTSAKISLDCSMCGKKNRGGPWLDMQHCTLFLLGGLSNENKASMYSSLHSDQAGSVDTSPRRRHPAPHHCAWAFTLYKPKPLWIQEFWGWCHSSSAATNWSSYAYKLDNCLCTRQWLMSSLLPPAD